MTDEIPHGFRSLIPEIVFATRHPQGPWLTINEQNQVWWWMRASPFNGACDCHGWYDSLDEAHLAVDRLMTAAAPYRMLIKKPRKRDVQRRKLYDWEDHYVIRGGEPMGMSYAKWQRLVPSECRHLIERVFKDHDQEVPELRFPKNAKAAWGGPDKISLPPWSRIHPVILHECAHGIYTTNERGTRKKRHGHGPDFVRCYIDLLVRYGGFTRKYLEASAIGFGLKVAGVALEPTESKQSLAEFMDMLIEQQLARDSMLELLRLEVAKRGLNTSPTLATIRAHLKFRHSQGKLLNFNSNFITGELPI